MTQGRRRGLESGIVAPAQTGKVLAPYLCLPVSAVWSEKCPGTWLPRPRSKSIESRQYLLVRLTHLCLQIIIDVVRFQNELSPYKKRESLGTVGFLRHRDLKQIIGFPPTVTVHLTWARSPVSIVDGTAVWDWKHQTVYSLVIPTAPAGRPKYMEEVPPLCRSTFPLLRWPRRSKPRKDRMPLHLRSKTTWDERQRLHTALLWIDTDCSNEILALLKTWGPLGANGNGLANVPHVERLEDVAQHITRFQVLADRLARTIDPSEFSRHALLEEVEPLLPTGLTLIPPLREHSSTWQMRGFGSAVLLIREDTLYGGLEIAVTVNTLYQACVLALFFDALAGYGSTRCARCQRRFIARIRDRRLANAQNRYCSLACEKADYRAAQKRKGQRISSATAQSH